MIGTPRRTCRGRPIICPGPCNHRRQKRIEKKSAEKPHWHACSWFNMNDIDEDDDDRDDENEIDVGKVGLPVRADEIATMTANVTLVDVALSQMTVCLEKKEEQTSPCPVSIRCESPECSGVSETKAVGLCPDREQNSNAPTTTSVESSAKDSAPKIKECMKRKKKISKYSVYLLVFCLYALVHMFLAVLATRVSLYEAFLSTQVCGIAAFLFWRATGTIPL